MRIAADSQCSRCSCNLAIVRVRAALLLLLSAALLTPACGLLLPMQQDADVPEHHPECRAERFLYAGRGTFAELGLVGQSLAPLPDPERPAMIWVTENRILCFEFDDGSGGSDWPIDQAWLPPPAIHVGEVATTTGLTTQVLALVAVAVGLIIPSILAFRMRT